MKRILLIALFISTSVTSQSIGINDLISFKTKSIGDIEEILIMENWILDGVYENNRDGVFALLGNEIHYVFVLLNYYDEEIAKISITFNDKKSNSNGIKYTTENRELNRDIVNNLKRFGYSIIDTGVDLINMNFDPKVGDILVKDSFSKTYSNGSNKLHLSTNKFVKVIRVDFDAYYTKDHQTKYELSL